ncbi:MAG: glycoside hydrolase family 3 protein [Bacteroidota bacterium]
MEEMILDQETLQKVEQLLQKMTLDQKIGQMTQTERMAISPEEVKRHHIGSILSGGGSCPGQNRPEDWVQMNDAYWAASMEADEQHLAIPILYGVDAIHGHNNVIGATIFPHNIGLGAANDPDLLERIAEITAREILATGVEWTFAPTLAVARNNQWGRTYESYSENPEIIQSYAGGFVRGLQGDLGTDSVIACVKHWVGDGGTVYGIDQGDTQLSEEELTRLHIAPYYPALAEGVLTVMASFNSWNGDKCHGHKYLLTDILKDELGFEGFIISDWDGIDYLTESYFDAVAMGVNAGIDMFMVSEKWREFIAHVRTNVEQGKIPMERIDDAVRRILYVKFKYGLFEKLRPAKRFWSNHESFGSKAHRAVAREAVRKSLVLLKNENKLLPLRKDARIIVAGKNADNCGHQCGGFTVAWQGVSDKANPATLNGNHTVTADYGSANAGVQQGVIEGGTSIWKGIKAMASNAVLSKDGKAADPQQHDVGIVVIGETPYAEGMGDIRQGDNVIVEMGSYIKGLMKVLHPYGSSLTLNHLHPEDLYAIKNITDQSIPVVVVLVSGRPLIINKELEQATAFVAAWLPGSEGQGVADVLFGDHDFQGKLSFTWQKKEGERYLKGDDPYDPLFPYGFGLRYNDAVI